MNYKWGMGPSAACDCGVEKQFADHVITSCSIYRHPCGNSGLTTVDGNLVSLLKKHLPYVLRLFFPLPEDILHKRKQKK